MGARSADGGRRDVAVAAAASQTKVRVHCCVQCGRAANVHVLEGYDRGRPVVRRFCLDCADDAAPWSGPQPSADLRAGLPPLVALGGFVLVVVGLCGDFLVPHRHAGFGLYQQTGVVLAMLLVFIGALLRVGPLALAGVFLLAASVAADWFGLISGAGIGWKQQAMITVGVVLTLGGLGVWLRGRRRLRLSVLRWREDAAARPTLSGTGAS